MEANEVVNVIPEDSWLRDWMELWVAHEYPKSYLLLSALAMTGAALGRKVWYGDRDIRPLWPMLNVLLIGPSGTGKSSAIMLSRRLLYVLSKADQPQFIMGGATMERLHADLLPQPKAILFASELANFFNRQKYNEALVPYVTELLDYEPVERRTVAGSIIRIPEPSVTVVGGSTVEWLQEQLPDAAVAGGFLARFLICEEPYKSQRVADPETALTKAQQKRLDVLRHTVEESFLHSIAAAGGQLKFRDYGVHDEYSYWYMNHKPVSGTLAPFAARAHEFVKRMAMLFAVSAFRDAIYSEDLAAAISLYAYAESKLQSVVVPYTATGKIMKQILGVIGISEMTEKEILQAMLNTAGSHEVLKYLGGLQMAGVIELRDGRYRRIKQ